MGYDSNKLEELDRHEAFEANELQQLSDLRLSTSADKDVEVGNRRNNVSQVEVDDEISGFEYDDIDL